MVYFQHEWHRENLFCTPHLKNAIVHYDDVVMDAMGAQITSLAIVYSSVYSGADQRKHQSSASLPFGCGIHRGPVNSPHKWPVTRKMFPFDDVVMLDMIILGHQRSATICLILQAMKSEYSGWIRSLPWLLMPWILTSTGHHQPWYLLCRTNIKAVMWHLLNILVKNKWKADTCN